MVGLDILPGMGLPLPYTSTDIVSYYHCTPPSVPHSELKSGTLTQNRISDGTEVLLVPALETGVAVSMCVVCGVWCVCVTR